MDQPGSGTADLSDFQRRRLDLADMLRAVLPATRAAGDERREKEVRSLLARLAAGRFQLAIAGQFSRGKTTLMNALLGGRYLPAGALPTTSVITTVRYGTRARALVRSHATALPVQVPVTDVARFVAEASTDRIRMRVASVDVELPAELLRLGFEFVDTPGIGSAIAANTAATLQYLPQADAVIFVTGFDSALTGAEADFLAGAARQAGKLFLVINKRDLVAEPQAAEVAGYVARWARQNLRAAEPAVFGLSALDALESAVAADASRLTRSGIEPFRAALIQFLTTEQGRTSLRAIAAAAADVVSRQRRDLRAGSIAADGRDTAAVAAEFESRMKELLARLMTVADRIAGTVAAAVPGVAAEHADAWRADLLDRLEALTGSPRDIASEAGDRDAGSEAAEEMQAALDSLRAAGRQVAGDWLAERAAELRAAMLGVTGGDISSLLELARSPREQGAELAGLATFPTGPAGWSAEDVPDLLAPAVDWIVPDPHPRRQRRRGGSDAQAAQVVADCLVAAAERFVARSMASLADAAADWAVRLREQALRQARAEAGQFRRYLLNQPSAEDLALLAEVAKQLADYCSSLTGRQPDTARIPEQRSERVAAGGHGRPCEICRDVEAALNDYLIGRQFTLATLEDDQARHAASGGFCALHTWQYARMASPVGISAGNARLAAAVADALEKIGSRASGVDELAEQVGQIAAPPVCAACTVLASAEDTAAAAVAARPASGTPAALCVRHLWLVLRAGPDRDAAMSMTVALVQALRGASADMRSYALKREALRRGLITDDEAEAYRDALSLLAGPAALAQSWEAD